MRYVTRSNAADAMFQNPEAHGPGPPQRPHPPGAELADDFDFPDAPSAPTANTLSARAVFAEPHEGHFTFVSPLIVRTSCSNFVSQALHVYS